MRFHTLDCSFELIASLRTIVARLDRRDRDLARQIRRAATSISLNLAEGSGRSGKDRLHHYRIARGSTMKVNAALRAAVAWGPIDKANAKQPQCLAEKVLAMISGLLR